MRRSPEIEAVIRRLLAARSSGDFTTVANLFSSSDDLRLIGSDIHEWYQGATEVVGISQAHWREQSFTDETLIRIEAFENGDTGWAAFEQTRNPADTASHNYRVTTVLQLESSAWKIVQIHFSIPVTNEEIDGVELTRTLSTLPDSIDVASELHPANDWIARSATIVFTDIVGSTALSESLGDSVWSQLIGDHFNTLKQISAHEEGVTVKTLGDGAMLAFPTAASALIAATRIQQATSALSNPEIPVRIGVHSGDVVQTEDDYLGLTVNKAARVAAAAEGGQILVSATTADMVNATEFKFGSPATFDLKGIDRSHVLLPLLWD